MIDNQRTYTVPVIDFYTFRQMILDHLVDSMKDHTPRDICNSFIGDGVNKIDRDEIGNFMKSLLNKVCLPPVAVDIGDELFYWLVSNNEAILVKKSVDNKQINVKVQI